MSSFCWGWRSCGGLWKHWKTSSNFTVSSPLPHFSWMKQEALQPPDGALMMSLPVLCPENVISEGCRDRLQIIYYFYSMHLSDIGLRINPLRNSVHTCLRPAQRQGWSLWWCHQLGWCKYHGEVLPCPCPPPPPQSGEHPPEKLGIL